MDRTTVIAQAVLLLAALVPAGYVYYRVRFAPRPKPAYRSVAVLVLGDIGRSPRMMYHSESFAQNGFETFVVGYEGAQPPRSLLSLPRVHFIYLSPPPAFISRLPTTLYRLFAPLKVLYQVLSVLSALLGRIPHPPEYIIVQNPPSIPTLALVQLVVRLRGSKLIIDWHNLGYSILALRLGQGSAFVRLAKRFEEKFGQKAYAHLFVTNAMKEHLVKAWGLIGRTVVLHDRPPAHFHPASPAETHQSHHSGPIVTLRPDRPALLVTSTSWTPDEDFSILVRALTAYERRARVVNGTADVSDASGDADATKKGTKLPKVLMIVTGKGELREQYMEEIIRRETEGRWQWVTCRSAWLEAADYPLLLGSADIGISLHSSSSALDLPMKVVDMFGCGLPVCALGYPCLDELVKDGENGLVFKDSDELAEQLERLLTGFPNSPSLANLRGSLRRTHAPSHMPYSAPLKAGDPDSEELAWGSWSDNWDRLVRPLVIDGNDSLAEIALRAITEAYAEQN
ncbi:glycosyltransferase family 33 protein [Botryobasidium botryosum FD-172 SS1]|uniref:Chitobiosyldiphosphodolichol beta-mannosyltransferase n=1 Tax=Botryobasidium botryosum (strain FD-172 SS1) TaxID=930990 RepID=A0A067MYS8_BOTB1|nr:glycosyltransferase family 33 protein [Botryobasidium botryosum FD-172 SS1]